MVGCSLKWLSLILACTSNWKRASQEGFIASSIMHPNACEWKVVDRVACFQDSRRHLVLIEQ